MFYLAFLAEASKLQEKDKAQLLWLMSMVDLQNFLDILRLFYVSPQVENLAKKARNLKQENSSMFSETLKRFKNNQKKKWAKK